MATNQPKRYTLKPRPFSQLPAPFKSIISRARNLHKRIKKLRIPDLPREKIPLPIMREALGIVQTLEDILSPLIDWEALSRHVNYQQEARAIIQNAEELYLSMVRLTQEARHHLTGESIVQEEWDTEIVSFEEDGGEAHNALDYIESDILGDFIKAIPLLYAAYYDFETETSPITKIGPLQVFLEQGRHEVAPQDLVDESIRYALTAIEYVYKHLKSEGIPDFALAGPIVLEAGLPPLWYGGTYTHLDNEISITLKSASGISLSANYEQQRHSVIIRRVLSGAYRSSIDQPEQISMFYTIAHELGHRVYYRGLRPKRKELWEEIYATQGLSLSEIRRLHEFQLAGQRYQMSADRIRRLEKLNAPPNVIDEEKYLLNKSELEIKKALDTLDDELLNMFMWHKSYGFDLPIDTFSKMRWTTRYGRVNREEAFAETFVSALWPELALKSGRLVEELTQEETQTLHDLMWYFLRTIPAQKPRRY